MKNKGNGLFVISLDYETMWGAIFNEPVYKGYKSRTIEIEKIINSILIIFSKYNIHATWAIVAAIACSGKEEACKFAPENINNLHTNKTLTDFIKEIDCENSKYYFQSYLISKISNTKNQEIGTHTFSHFYMYEHNNPENKINKELNISKKILEKFTKQVNTLVLPKNQVNELAIKEMKNQGIKNIRGIQVSDRFNKRSQIGRIMRFIDAYLPICGKNYYPKYEIIKDGYFNVRASRFWRTYFNKLSIFEALKIIRIKKEMKIAARNGCVYHLWFHPHNLGTNVERNLIQLEEILRYYNELNKIYGFTSCTINECTQIVQEEENVNDKRD